MNGNANLPAVVQLQNSHAGSEALSADIIIPKDRSLVVNAITAKRTSNVATVELWDMSRNIAMQNAQFPPDLLAGTGNNPFYLPEPVIFPQNTQLRLNSADTSGAANAISVALRGEWQAPVSGLLTRVPFWLKVRAVIGGNGSGAPLATVPRGYRFEALGLVDSPTSTSYTIRLRTTRQGYFFTAALHRDLIVSTAAPFRPLGRRPWILGSEEDVYFELADLSGSSNTINLALFGILAAK